MSPSDITNKLWNYCHVLRDDGISYGYVEQFTYLLFLKMADEAHAGAVQPAQHRATAAVQLVACLSPALSPEGRGGILVVAMGCSTSLAARAVLRSLGDPALGSCLGRSADRSPQGPDVIIHCSKKLATKLPEVSSTPLRGSSARQLAYPPVHTGPSSVRDVLPRRHLLLPVPRRPAQTAFRGTRQQMVPRTVHGHAGGGRCSRDTKIRRLS